MSLRSALEDAIARCKGVSPSFRRLLLVAGMATAIAVCFLIARWWSSKEHGTEQLLSFDFTEMEEGTPMRVLSIRGNEATICLKSMNAFGGMGDGWGRATLVVSPNDFDALRRALVETGFWRQESRNVSHDGEVLALSVATASRARTLILANHRNSFASEFIQALDSIFFNPARLPERLLQPCPRETVAAIAERAFVTAPDNVQAPVQRPP